MIKVRFFTREGCHLCEQAREWLDSIQIEHPFELDVIDIDRSPTEGMPYIEKIPVVEVGGMTLSYPFSVTELKVAVITARRSVVSDPKKVSLVNRFMDGVDRHWFGAINGFFTLFFFGSFLAPIFSKYKMSGLADLVYGVYSFFCHQLGFRSFYLFGKQLFYPRAIANMDGFATFGQMTGINELDLFAARAHVGNEIMGYKIALCERDLGMYLGLALFGLLFIIMKRSIKGLPIWAWFLFALIPIALDGGTQLISQLPFQNLIPLRESTPILRSLTGFTFGFGTAWLTYPVIQAGMKKTV